MQIISFKDKNEAERVKDQVKNYLQQYLERQNVKIKLDGKSFHCFSKENHNNGDADASAGLSDDKRAFQCHGCGLKGDILTAVNIIEGRKISGKDYYNTLAYLADMFNVKYELSNGNKTTYEDWKHTATYDFINENGEIQFKSLRKELFENGQRVDKRDIPHITDKTGKLKSGFNGIPRILYRLPQLREAIKNNDTIFVVEGMKCADILVNIGLNATAIWGGSNAWTKPHTQNYIPELSGANIVILPDNDNQGKEFANQVAGDIKNIVNSIKMVDLNKDIALPEGGDIEEWLQLGGSKERLLELVGQAREWKPGQNEETESELPEWYEVNKKTKRVRVLTGVLARHLINHIPAIYSTGRFFLYKSGVYNICNNQEEKSVVMGNILDKYRTMNLVNDTTSQWSIDEKVRVNPDMLDKDPYILNLKNGLYDIKNKELKKHTSEYLSTVQLNIAYDSDAKGSTFDKFINESVPDEENRLLVQEMMGYSLTSFNNAKKAFVFNGKGDTGKSTFLNIIEDMVTAKHISNIPIQSLGDRFNTAELFGKLVNIYADLPSTPIRDGSLLKVLTGGDKVSAERKGQDPFTFLNKAKFIFSCNGLPPNYGDRSDAFYNRLIIIPFNNSVPKEKQDSHLRDKLKKELDYIFQWALKGLERLIENDFKFTENEATLKAIEDYKLNSNSVLMFINECCELEEDSYIPTTELYAEYKEFSIQNGFSPVSSIKFYGEIDNSFAGKVDRDKRVPGTRKRAIKGIKLIQATENNSNKYNKYNISTFPTAGGRI